MLSKLGLRFKKGDGSKSRLGASPTPPSSPNVSSSEMEALASPTRDWRSRSPKLWSKRISRSQTAPNWSCEATADDPSFSQVHSDFLIRYPTYAQTRELDDMREREFQRLQDSRSIYMDYMGACLYPDFLVKDHLRLLTEQVVGNTHSDSPSSTLSEKHVSAARQAVLSFFGAASEDYVCIFTSNCTSALKIVGESFPFEATSRLVLAEDSHNSVNGIRRFAERKGATVEYVTARLHGGFNDCDMLDALQDGKHSPSLLALTGQSNLSAFRPNLPVILSTAKQQGYCTLLDGAALASTSRISLSGHLNGQVDALAISFYKLFGYPTGVGALIARKDFLQNLKKPWFAGGTVELVGFPYMVTESKVPWERFEEGTLNYISLASIPSGLEMLKRLISGPTPVLPLRLGLLHQWLHGALEGIKHTNGRSVVKVLTPRRESVDSPSGMGYILCMTFHNSTGARIRNTEVSRRAAAVGISLRTGCACNPGATVGLLGLRDDMVRFQESNKDMSDLVIGLSDVELYCGQEVGVVRLSLGLVSNFRDVWEVDRLVKAFVE